MQAHIHDIETQWCGSRTIADQSSPWWLLQPAELPEIPVILEEIEPDTCDTFYPDAVEDSEFDESEFFWQQIPDADFAYLTTPRKHPEPCPWCGGRTTHTTTCKELRASWLPSMPFGQHKGKPLREVPTDYLEWLTKSTSCDSELRTAIWDELKGRA